MSGSMSIQEPGAESKTWGRATTRATPAMAGYFSASAKLAMKLAFAYFVADSLANRVAFSEGWTILWPLNGITIALLLMRNRGDWPAMLLGVELGTGIGECLNHNPIGFELVQRLISMSEVAISAWLLPSFETFETWLRSRFLFPRFVCALILGPGLTGIAAAVQLHFSQGQPYGMAFNSWATADALGVAATMPLALSLRSNELGKLFRAQALPRTLSILAIVFAVATAVFFVHSYPLLFLLFPALLLVESFLGFAGSSIAAFFICILAVYAATHGIGPFGMWPKALLVPRDIALQAFLGFNLIALFPASILNMERKRMSEELVRTNAQLTLLAASDALTGLPNRRTLDTQFASEWKRALRTETSLALLMVDIDHFKEFNDAYGHHAGDVCLQAVARALKASVQRYQDLVARFGGEEFAVLLPQTELSQAYHLAEKLRSAIHGLAIRHNRSATGSITISIGCAAATPSADTESVQLLRAADSALYTAKQMGRNRIQIADCSITATSFREDVHTVPMPQPL